MTRDRGQGPRTPPRRPPGRHPPHSDRAREGLLSTWQSLLGGPLAGERVLDLYAGSGAVGLEALPRRQPHPPGRGHARAARTIRENVKNLGLPGAEVRAGKAQQIIQHPPAPRTTSSSSTRPTPSQITISGRYSSTLRAQHWLAPEALDTVERSTRGGEFDWPPGSTRSRPVATARNVLVRSRALRAKTHDDRTGERRDHKCAAPSVPGRSTRSPTDTSTSTARASRLYDEVYVAVMINQAKKGLFEIEERIDRHPPGHRRVRERPRGVLPRPPGRLLASSARSAIARPARGQRLRLRTADGPDENGLSGGDPLHPHQPHLQLPLLLAGQGGRHLGAHCPRCPRWSSTPSPRA
ncbi:hypothetical protein SFUMM280S_08152 [Streptomyces fumanus]